MGITPFTRDKSSGKWKGFSYSGGERNRLFMQTEDGYFDASSFSNIDFRDDGRCFALFDFDSDGFLDIGLISTSKPKFRLLKNRFSGLTQPNDANWIKVALAGGNDQSQPSTEYSSRLPIGASMVLQMGTQKRMVKYTSFGGLSNQNSKWMHVGLGKNKKIDRISIVWPSGRETQLNDIDACQRLTIHEDGRAETQ